MIAKSASALLYDTALWYLVWVCGCVLCGGMSDAMDLKRCVTLFELIFSTGRSSRKSRVFDLIPQSENPVEKSWVDEALALFRLCKKTRFGLQPGKAVFD